MQPPYLSAFARQILLQGVEDNPIAAQKWIISDAYGARERKEARGGGANKKQARRSRICRAPQNPKFALLFYLVAKGLLERFHFDWEMKPIFYASFLEA